MRRKPLSSAACPIARSLDVIGDWWSLLLVRDALRGSTRFSEFQKSLGVSRNILTRRLRALVEQGVLETAPAEGTAYQEYRLTEKGRRLHHVLVALGQWGLENMPPPPGVPRMALVDREKHEPVPRLQVRAADGRLLEPGDTMMLRIE